VNEGDNPEYRISTTNIPNGTTLYWTLSVLAPIGYTPAVGADLTSTNGSFVVNSNEGVFNVPIFADSLLEGLEAFRIDIREGSITGNILYTSNRVLINDTSV
jgi:hypothetical protein